MESSAATADQQADTEAQAGAGIRIVVKDLTSPGTFSPTQLFNLVWGAGWGAENYYNRSPWVEHGFTRPVQQPGAVRLLEPNDPIPAGAWVIELVDISSEPGALGWHEDQARISKAGPSGAHSKRGIAIHPDTGEEIPKAIVAVKTSEQDGVFASEVLFHELFEMLVDPYVMDESKVRKYLNPADGYIYIAEVGDPVQDEPFPLGAHIEGAKPLSPCPPECMVSNFAWPEWWAQETTRKQFDQAGTRTAAWQLAPGGYMSRAPEASPEAWEQIYGSEKAKAEANAHAYERPGEVG